MLLAENEVHDNNG